MQSSVLSFKTLHLKLICLESILQGLGAHTLEAKARGLQVWAYSGQFNDFSVTLPQSNENKFKMKINYSGYSRQLCNDNASGSQIILQLKEISSTTKIP